jgi:hypothetical protein
MHEKALAMGIATQASITIATPFGMANGCFLITGIWSSGEVETILSGLSYQKKILEKCKKWRI